MKSLKGIFIGLGLFTILFILPGNLPAQTAASVSTAKPAASDSIVQLTAEAQGLSLVSRVDLPPFGTYWLVMTRGAAPLPCPPLDQSLPIYAITDGQFIVDGTGGQTTSTNDLMVEAATVVNLINQAQSVQSRRMAGAMSLDGPPSPGDGGGGGDYTNLFYSTYSIDTNLLWLELTNVSSGVAYANLHHATNEVYAIWWTTNLIVPFADWQVATELWPMDTNCQPFTVLTQGWPELFLRAEDWMGVDANTNGLPDWWEWKYFGNFNQAASGDYDGDGVDNATEYANGTDPNQISFTVRLGNQNFNTTNATGSYLVLGGVPNYAAVLVNDADLSHAVWLPYDGSINMNLGPTDGVYQVRCGLKGRAADSVTTWLGTEVTLNRSAPQIVLTSRTSGTVAQPYLQLQGYATQPLATVTYDLNGVTNQLGTLTDTVLDTNLLAYTTNYFQCYDLLLSKGTNFITLHATDAAGNTTTTNLAVTLNFGTATNPVIQVIWPPDGARVAGNSFTLRGWTEDAAASVNATITATNGNVSTATGVVERDGTLWVENLPLATGTNRLTLCVTNAAGYSSATNLNVVKSDLTLAVTSIDGDLWLPTVNVSGSISDPIASIVVNGVAGTNNGDGTWSAAQVPTGAGGMASFNVSANTGGSNCIAASNLAKPDEVKLASGIWQNETYWGANDGSGLHNKDRLVWSRQQGGSGHSSFSVSGYEVQRDFTVGSDEAAPEPWSHTYDSSGADYYATNTGYASTPWIFGALSASNQVAGISNLVAWFQGSAKAKVFIYSGGPMPAGSRSLYEVSAGSVTETVVNRQPTSGSLVISTDVPPSQVTVSGFGRNLDTNRMAYHADANVPAKEITLSAAVPKGDFNEDGGKFKLRISFGGHDVTDSNSPVVVGQLINPTCGWLGGSGPAITNYSWTVPGYAISNYVVNATSGILYTDFIKTNNGVNFYWVDGGDKQVSCTVQTAGESLTAKTTFGVTRPLPTFSSHIIGVVAADTNYYAGGSQLHFGIDFTTNYGIIFQLSGAPVQYWLTPTNPIIYGSYFMTQIIDDIHMQRNEIVGTNVYGEEYETNGLDTHQELNGISMDILPVELADNTSFHWGDSPASQLKSALQTLGWEFRSDSFTSYLMFQPSTGIAVPMYKVSWSWSGTARTNGTPDGYDLLSHSSPPPSGPDVTEDFPQWTNVVGNPFIFHTNSTPFNEN